MTDIWLEATDLENPNRIGAMRKLMDKLWLDGLRGESLEVGKALIEVAVEKNDLEALAKHAYFVASRLASMDQTAESIEVVDAVLRQPTVEMGEFDLGFIHLQQGQNFAKLERHVEAIHEVEQAVICLENSGGFTIKAMALQRLAEAHLEMGNLEEAKKFFAEAIDGLEQGNDPAGVATCKAGLASLLLDEGSAAMALKYAKDSLSLCRFTENEPGIQECHLLVGKCHEALGHLDAAMQQYEQAALTRIDEPERKIAGEAEYRIALLNLDHLDAAKGFEKLEQVVPVLQAVGLRNLADEAEDRLAQQVRSERG